MTSSAERNLIFGILALEGDFLTEQELSEGLRIWTTQKEDSLGDVLVQQERMPESLCHAINVLVDEHIAAHSSVEQSLAILSGFTMFPPSVVEIRDPDLRRALGILGITFEDKLIPEPFTELVVSDPIKTGSFPERAEAHDSVLESDHDPARTMEIEPGMLPDRADPNLDDDFTTVVIPSDTLMTLDFSESAPPSATIQLGGKEFPLQLGSDESSEESNPERPASARQGLISWVKQNPAPTTLAVGLILAMFAGSVVSNLFALRAKEQARIAEQAAAKAKEQFDHVELSRKVADSVAKLASANEKAARLREYETSLNLAQQYWYANNFSAMQEILSRYPDPNSAAADPRGFEWHYWNRLAHDEIRTFAADRRALDAIAFRPDGKQIACGDVANKIRIWDVASGQQFALLEGDEKGTANPYVSSLSYSPDGKILAATSYGGKFILWDCTTAKMIRVISDVAMSMAQTVRFSPNGSQIAVASLGHGVRFFDVATGEQISPISKPIVAIASIAYSPNGEQLASVDLQGTFAIHDLKTGGILFERSGIGTALHSVAFSPDGSRIAIGCADHIIRQWDVKSASEITPLTGHNGSVSSVQFSHDGGLLASASDDSTIRLWSARTGETLAILKGHTQSVHEICFNSTGTHLASCSWDGTAKLWGVSAEREAQVLRAEGKAITCVAISPDEQHIASGSKEGRIAIWDRVSGRVLRSFSELSSEVLGIWFSSDGAFLFTVSADHWIRKWNVATGAVAAKHSISQNGRVVAASMSRGSCDHLAIAVGAATVIWNLATEKESFTIPSKEGEITAIAIDAAAKNFAVAASDHVIRLRELPSGNHRQSYTGHTQAITALSFSTDAKCLASASYDGTVKLWDVESGRLIHPLSARSDIIRFLQFSSDGGRLATAGDEPNVNLWNTATGMPLASLEGHSSMIRALCFSSNDDVLIAAGDDRTIRLWEGKPAGKENIARDARRLLECVERVAATKARIISQIEREPSCTETVRSRALKMAAEIIETPSRTARILREQVLCPTTSVTQRQQTLSTLEERNKSSANSDMWLTLLAAAQYRAGDSKSAAQTLAKRARRSGDDELLCLEACILHTAGENEKALACLAFAEQRTAKAAPGLQRAIEEAARVLAPQRKDLLAEQRQLRASARSLVQEVQRAGKEKLTLVEAKAAIDRRGEIAGEIRAIAKTLLDIQSQTDKPRK